LSPQGMGGHLQLADVLLAQGLPRAALETLGQEPNEVSRLIGLALVYHALGRRTEADAVLKDLVRKYGSASNALADVYVYRGETDRAFAVLDAAVPPGAPHFLPIQA